MAKIIDTRKDGRGLKYTAYDSKLVDYAKAPGTGIDPDKKFKIGKPKVLEKPGDVEYFGSEFKDEAQKLADERMAAYRRRQTNEYIRTGAKAPGDRVSKSTSGVRIGQLRGEGFTAANRAAKQAERMQQVGTQRAALVEKGQQTMTNMNPTANLKVAAKSFNNLTGTAAEGLTTFRSNKDDEGLV
jgi:hypothetical protein